MDSKPKWQGSLSSYTPTMREKMASILAKGWYGDTREGYRKAGNLLNVGETVVPPLGLLNGAYDAGRALGGGNVAQAGLLGGLAMLPLPGSAKKGIRAFHGSPNKFDRFDLSKAGSTTDSGQLGRGIYLSTDPRVSNNAAHKYEADVNLSNPIHLSLPDFRTDKQKLVTDFLGIPSSSSAADISKAATSKGYDGVILDYSPTGYQHQEIAVFNDNLVKIRK